MVEGLLGAFGREVCIGLGYVGIEGGERCQAEVDGFGGEMLRTEIGDPGGDVGFGNLPGFFVCEAEEEFPGPAVGALGVR